MKTKRRRRKKAVRNAGRFQKVQYAQISVVDEPFTKKKPSVTPKPDPNFLMAPDQERGYSSNQESRSRRKLKCSQSGYEHPGSLEQSTLMVNTTALSTNYLNSSCGCKRAVNSLSLDLEAQLEEIGGCAGCYNAIKSQMRLQRNQVMNKLNQEKNAKLERIKSMTR